MAPAHQACAAGKATGTREFHLRFVPCTWERFDEVAALRYEVLHAPFGVAPSTDWQDDDPTSRHLVAVAESGEVIGYARLITLEGGSQIRQVAVAPDRQRSGVGSALVLSLVAEAHSRGARGVWLNARLSAIAFYERLGFTPVGDVFTTGKTGLPHRRMVYRET